MTKLRLSGVWKQFSGHAVLRGIELSVEEHQVVGLIGASGSGKSTLLRCVNLLETIDDGAIWLDGDDISAPDADPDKVRRRIGMVFQSYNLFPHMSVMQNLQLASRKIYRLPRSTIEQKALDLLGRFGLSDKATAYPDRLSGGQQQRVAIARSLMTDPEILLLDEVTSALDPELVGEVLEIIRTLKENGMTMVMATHEMRFCREVADTVCFLDDGRVLEQSHPEELFTQPVNQRTKEFLRRVLPR